MIKDEYKVLKIKHIGTEGPGFVINRPSGFQQFLFIHFMSPVNIKLNHSIIHEDPGACIIYSPFSEQWFSADGEQLVHGWIRFSPEDPTFLKKLALPFNQVFRPAYDEFITPDIKTMEVEFINREDFWEERLSALLKAFLIRLQRSVTHAVKPNMTAYKTALWESFKQFRLQLYSTPEKPWTVDAMANQMLLSKSRFSVLYHEFFQVSPKEDLIAARMAYAKRLLEDTALGVAHIADKSGYTNVYHFIRQFKALTGLTPGEYARKST